MLASMHYYVHNTAHNEIISINIHMYFQFDSLIGTALKGKFDLVQFFISMSIVSSWIWSFTLLHYVLIVPTILTELLSPLKNDDTPLHIAAWCGYSACVECLLSTPGIDVNIRNAVSCFTG